MTDLVTAIATKSRYDILRGLSILRGREASVDPIAEPAVARAIQAAKQLYQQAAASKGLTGNERACDYRDETEAGA